MAEGEERFIRTEIRGWLASSDIDDGDWADVLRRGRRPRRRRAVMVAVLVAGVMAVVASAVGLSRFIVHFSRAPSAPRSVVLNFQAMPMGAPAGMAPGVIPGQTRLIARVTVDGTAHSLWVAPTTYGGFCDDWSHLTGGCRRSRTGRGAARIAITASYGRGGLSVITGSFFDAQAARLDLILADRGKVAVPFYWVTAPIDAGFFIYHVPANELTANNRLVSIVVYARDGRVLSVVSAPSPGKRAPNAAPAG